VSQLDLGLEVVSLAIPPINIPMPDPIPSDPSQMTSEQLRAASMSDEQLASELSSGRSPMSISDLKSLTLEELSQVIVSSEPPPPEPSSPPPPPEPSSPPPDPEPSEPASYPSYGDGSCGGYPPT
jgi:hypothetical protein